MAKLSVLLVLLVVALEPGPARSVEPLDDNEEVLTQLARAERQMRQGDWFRAARTYEGLAGQFPESPDYDLFLLGHGKARYYLGEFSAALAIFDNYLDHYQSAPEAPYVLFFRGNVNYRLGDLDQALYDFVYAYRLSCDERLDDLAIRSVVRLVTNASPYYFDPDLFAPIEPDRRCRLLRACSEALLAAGEAATAQSMLELCGEALPPTDPRLSQSSGSGGLKVAMILPFSGELRSWAEDIYNGAVIAVQQADSLHDINISLESLDSQADAVGAALLAGKVADSRKYRAAVGPLTSSAAAVTVARLSCEDLPLIVPAATQAGLAQLAPSAFQLSPHIGLQGSVMARYAVEHLGAQTAAIITSTATDHLRMARAFSDEFEAAGGTVEIIEYYRSRDTDFGKYLRDLKAALLGFIPDSAFYISPDGDTLDPDGVPVFLDCLYLPGQPEELRLLLPQIRFYKIQGAYLGSDGWGDEVVYRLGDNVTRGAVFPSPFLGVSQSPEFHQFAAAYDTRYGGRPPRLACLGYDALNLIARAVEAGHRSRRDITNYLSQISDDVGASGGITFGEHGENLVMPLYRIENEQAEPLEFPEPAAADSTR